MGEPLNGTINTLRSSINIYINGLIVSVKARIGGYDKNEQYRRWLDQGFLTMEMFCR